MNNEHLVGDLFPSDIKTAGKVNFNTLAKNDYSTNEAFKTLRTNLLFCGNNIKTILITSTQENEGKSTISTELSKSLAEVSKRTLMIDADMRKSVILRRNIKSQGIMGLSELLSGQADINQVVYNTQDPYFDIIFSGHFPPNPVELLSSEIFNDMLKNFEAAYDYIIIDSPPLGAVIDAAMISANCDGAIIVISPQKAKIQEIENVKLQISKSGCKILGAIINETNPKHRDRSRQYKQNYYYASENKFKKNK